MTKKKEGGEEFVFEFYDEDYAKSLEDIEKSVKKEEYNEIDFEEGKKFRLSSTNPSKWKSKRSSNRNSKSSPILFLSYDNRCNLMSLYNKKREKKKEFKIILYG